MSTLPFRYMIALFIYFSSTIHLLLIGNSRTCRLYNTRVERSASAVFMWQSSRITLSRYQVMFFGNFASRLPGLTTKTRGRRPLHCPSLYTRFLSVKQGALRSTRGVYCVYVVTIVKSVRMFTPPTWHTRDNTRHAASPQRVKRSTIQKVNPTRSAGKIASASKN